MAPPELPPTLRWEGDASGRLYILDQTLLPDTEREIELPDAGAVRAAIRRLAVRGAPAIGIAAAYGLVLAAQALPPDLTGERFLEALRVEADRLAGSRPTAVNLSFALDRLLAAVRSIPESSPAEIRALLLDEARLIHEEDRAACLAMARHSAVLVRDRGTYLTHCNAGALATGGCGTALGVFHEAARHGKRITVYADETRPLLQGARLTAWELRRSGIDVILICDSASASVLASGQVDAVFVGADRIAANGDVANKIGTLAVALAAHRYDVPFYVVAPLSTLDAALPDGSAIPIEERDPAEVTGILGRRTAPSGVKAFNPAFDVTPAALVRAIITERGPASPPGRETLAALVAP